MAANKRPLIEVALQTPHHLAGIRVAVASNAMRPGEFFILYLAIGAPHGVAYFLQQQSNSVMQITKAAGVIFLWPLVWIKRARARHTRKQVSETFSEEFDPAFFAKIEASKRQLLAAFASLQEELSESTSPEKLYNEEAETSAREFRLLLEKYLELIRLVKENSRVLSPSKREMELALLSGRSGADLFLAGMSVHRRNLNRLVAHRQRAGEKLLRFLIQLRLEANSSADDFQQRAPVYDRVAESIIRLFVCAFDLVSIVEDRHAALAIARLHDLECARLRARKIKQRRSARHHLREDDARLTARLPNSISADRAPGNTLTQA